MFDIVYNREKKRVKQQLDTIYLNDLEGKFDDVLFRLTNLRNDLIRDYVDQAKEISTGNGYLNGADKRSVQFDSLFLRIEDTYFRETGGDERYLKIWGERNFTTEELKALEKETELQKRNVETREKEELKRLQEKYVK